MSSVCLSFAYLWCSSVLGVTSKMEGTIHPGVEDTFAAGSYTTPSEKPAESGDSECFEDDFFK